MSEKFKFFRHPLFITVALNDSFLQPKKILLIYPTQTDPDL